MMSGGGGNQRQMPGSSESVPTPPGKNGGMNQTPDMSGNNRGIPNGQGNPPALPDGETPPEVPENGDSTFLPQIPGNGERPERADNGGGSDPAAVRYVLPFTSGTTVYIIKRTPGRNQASIITSIYRASFFAEPIDKHQTL